MRKPIGVIGLEYKLVHEQTVGQITANLKNKPPGESDDSVLVSEKKVFHWIDI